MVKIEINKNNVEIQCEGTSATIITEMVMGVKNVLERLKSPIPPEQLCEAFCDTLHYSLKTK